MNKQKAFLLRLPEEERGLAKQLARQLGYSENRLYNELIHDGLLMREQMLYMRNLKNAYQKVTAVQVLELLDKVPNVAPESVDVISN
jgi:hypothetical protein